MKRKTLCLLVLFTLFAFTIFSQTTEGVIASKEADTASVNALLKQSKTVMAENPDKAIELATQAGALADKIGFSKGKAYALKNIGLGNYYKGKYLETLEYFNASLAIFEQLRDDLGEANLLNNIAGIYVEQGDEAKGLEFSLQSLKLSEKVGDKLRILSALNTIGSIYSNKPATYDKALGYLKRALPLCDSIGDNAAYGTIAGNIGDIYLQQDSLVMAEEYFNQSIKKLGNNVNSSFAYNGIGRVNLKKGNYTLALAYHNKALVIDEKQNSNLPMLRTLEGIANVYIGQKDYRAALINFKKASAIGEELKAQDDLKDIYLAMSVAYVNIEDYKNAYKYKSLYSVIKDTLYNLATYKKLGSLQFDFALEKKQGEITLLTKDKALSDLQVKRQKFATNAFAAGLALVLMIAALIFRNYREKVKTNRLLDQQKAQIEDLLLNILPAEVANELKENGKAIPRNYDSVSVMFTDFKGFTTIADKMSPQALVEELNDYFIEFDRIIGKHNLEKIKTIGDAYMCAGGIPTPDERHVFNIIKASLDIQAFAVQNNIKRFEAGLEPWDLRIGIHVGPIVAGVVGRRKYAYDIWGSTVNIASRMESNGEPGQVNISAATYELVKHEFNCIYRGKIYAKNVGEIDMYFVEKIEHLQQSEMSSNTIVKNSSLSN